MSQKSIGAETLFLHEDCSYTLYPEIVKLLVEILSHPVLVIVSSESSN